MLEDNFSIWKLKCGNEKALHHLYQKHKDNLFTIADLLVNDKITAENILLNIFLSFAGNIEGFYLSPELPRFGDSIDEGRLRRFIRRLSIEVLIIDPLYLCDIRK